MKNEYTKLFVFWFRIYLSEPQNFFFKNFNFNDIKINQKKRNKYLFKSKKVYFLIKP